MKTLLSLGRPLQYLCGLIALGLYFTKSHGRGLFLFMIMCLIVGGLLVAVAHWKEDRKGKAIQEIVYAAVFGTLGILIYNL